VEQLGQSAHRALARSSESNAQPQNSSAKARAVKVWLAMAELYGPAFAAAYGDQPSQLWLAAIAGLSDEQCRNGLTTLAKQAREYPANLTQFVAACRPPSGPPRYLGVPIDVNDPRLALPPPSKQASPEKVDGWLAKIRGRLNGAAQDSGSARSS
jgi:hypothetical protein